MGNPVVHFEIMGKEGGALQSFYADLFGWKIDANNPMNYGMVDTGGEGGIAGGVGATPDGSSCVTVYIQVPDPQGALDRVEATGGKTVMPVMDVPGGPTIAQFADPAGNVVGLVQVMD